MSPVRLVAGSRSISWVVRPASRSARVKRHRVIPEAPAEVIAKLTAFWKEMKGDESERGG